MKPSLQNPRISTIWKLILKKSEKHKLIETINTDIENIITFENRNKVYTTQCGTIYEVIEP